MVFPHDDWGKNAGDYTSDFHRARRARTDKWEFEVRTDDPSREVTLSWQAFGNYPSEGSLTDEQTQTVTPMSGGSYRFLMGSTVRAFTWTVRKK